MRCQGQFIRDNDGNVISDGYLAYLYDANGHVCAGDLIPHPASMVEYVYDAEGNRVAKGTITSKNCDMTSNGFVLTGSYVVGLNGEQVSETNGSLQWVHSNVYANGKLLARQTSTDTVFIHNDWQGTERVRSKYDGTSYETCTNLPFGDSQTCTVAGAAADPSPLHYTGKMRDTETGLDYFGARYYASGMAHWMSPDWADKPTSVPYANFGDPQTLNLYAFVSGNPVSHTDSDGHLITLQQLNSFNGSGAATAAQTGGLIGTTGAVGYNLALAISRLSEHADEAESRYASIIQGDDDPEGIAHETTETPAQGTDYVSVSYWPKGAGGFGHIGIGVNTDDTQGYSTADPHVPWYKRIFGAPAGAPEDDIQAHTKNGEVASHSYLHIPISADQAAAMKGAMADRVANGGHYNLIFNNCAQFVEGVLHAGGVSGVPHAEVFGPAILGGILWTEH